MAAPRARPAACLLLLLACAAGCGAQFGPPGGGKPNLPPAVRSDINFIKCDVCQHFVKQAMRAARKLREDAGAKRLEEADIIDKLEQLCAAARPEGEWIRALDMVEEGGAIKLEDMGKTGKHTTETSTIARACVDVSEALDLSDLSEALYKGKTRAQLVQLACYDMSGACSKKPPPVPEDRPSGPEFEPLSKSEADRERLMAQLSASGMGGQLYDTAALKEQMQELQGRSDGGEFGEGVALTEPAAAEEGGGGGGGAAARLREGLGAARGAAGKLLKGLSGRLGGGGGGGGAGAGAEL